MRRAWARRASVGEDRQRLQTPSIRCLGCKVAEALYGYSVLLHISKQIRAARASCRQFFEGYDAAAVLEISPSQLRVRQEGLERG